MKSFLWFWRVWFLALAAASFESSAAAPGKTYDFPIYKNKPVGRQLSGAHAPATTPALSPEDAHKKFVLPPGFEIRLFASEPEVVNPVAMTWDQRGRLWVVELYEYPLGAKPGEKPRDRIKILEDTDADGRADRISVFADGLNLATGILLGHGGVYVGQAPHLLFLKDTDGDDKADSREILLTGFGMEDRHELLNSFTWGPDGWLYLTHGVFTFSKVADPEKPNLPPVIMTAAVARFHPRSKKFEVVAEGTSNPWGVDFDRAGNAFVSACVIDHLFHMAPGGIYVRQAGNPPFPYGYELLPSIVDHKHHMAAYAGVQVYQGNQYPEEYRGTILMGNIHDNAIHQDRLTPNGSSFKASFIKDFVRANDGWFMPVSTQTGPDGGIWIMDWYDRYPCYQNANADPDGVDREYGRIWRVVHTGEKKGAPLPSRPDARMDLAKLSGSELVQTLSHANVWHRRQAQRLLGERRDAETRGPLQNLLRTGATLEGRLAALWTLHSSDFLSEESLDLAAADREAPVRAWTARLTGERGLTNGIERLTKLAKDADASVRLAVATAARQFVSGALTVDTPPAVPLKDLLTGGILLELLNSSFDAKDPLIPFMCWMAAEPYVVQDPVAAVEWFPDSGMSKLPLSAQLLVKIMRRVCDLPDGTKLDKSIEALGALTDNHAPLVLAALTGLIEGQRGKARSPGQAAMDVVARFAKSSNPEIAARAQQLGTLWGDAAALNQMLAVMGDTQATMQQRLQAIQAVKQQKIDPVREALLALVGQGTPGRLVEEAVRALSEVGGDNVGEELLKSWKPFTPSARRVLADALASRRRWALPFLAAVERGDISASEVPVPVRRTLTQSKDDYLRNRAHQALGRYRETGADKLKLIAEKKRIVLAGAVDMKAGHEVAQRACLTCHKLHGEGAEVGPDLTGVGRSTLDALLANIIDPNQIIGKGYENVEVETKDGRTLSGRLVENTEARIKLLSAGPKEDVVAKSEIASTRISELSAMPEGLEQMPDADFRNLIWYILNPPQDHRPLTPELRKQLIGDETPSASVGPPNDSESVALWNPEWQVICPDFEGAPKKLPEFAGRRNVLMAHPADQRTGAALERAFEVPSGSKATLTFSVAADERGDWELRVLADRKLLQKQLVDPNGDRWKNVSIDLSKFAGNRITVRLENCANDWNYEFGYWSDVRVVTETSSLASGPLLQGVR
ncbi:MAG: c-type cytochrome [Verrucomicrobiales bacterium]|nr:c-type cytochrome [Verrucomicrobiales bacterium]